MAPMAADFQARCSCGSVKVDGVWTRSPGIVIKAAALSPIPKEACGECTGKGPMLGGYPVASALGERAA
jgi:hypothetical protein